MPSPQVLLWRLFGSPMPAHTMFGLPGAIAMSPTDIVATYGSETASQVVPLFLLRNTPPDALATKMMRGSDATASMSSTRRRRVAGPMCRQLDPPGQGRAAAGDGTGGAAPRPADICARQGWPSMTLAATATSRGGGADASMEGA